MKPMPPWTWTASEASSTARSVHQALTIGVSRRVMAWPPRSSSSSGEVADAARRARWSRPHPRERAAPRPGVRRSARPAAAAALPALRRIGRGRLAGALRHPRPSTPTPSRALFIIVNMHFRPAFGSPTSQPVGSAVVAVRDHAGGRAVDAELVLHPCHPPVVAAAVRRQFGTRNREIPRLPAARRAAGPAPGGSPGR